MNARALRWLLFAALVCTLPWPFYLGDVEWSPPLRLAFLSALFAGVALAEGGGTSSLLAVLGVLQTALAWLGCLALAAAATRALGLLPAPGLRAGAAALIVVGLVAFSLGDVYQTALSSTRPRAGIGGMFE